MKSQEMPEGIKKLIKGLIDKGIKAGAIEINRETGEFRIFDLDGNVLLNVDNGELSKVPADKDTGDFVKGLHDAIVGAMAKTPEGRKLASEGALGSLLQLCREIDADSEDNEKGDNPTIAMSDDLRAAWNSWIGAIDTFLKEKVRERLAQKSPKDRLDICFHEAAHAVATLEIGRELDKPADFFLEEVSVAGKDTDIMIQKDGFAEGYSMFKHYEHYGCACDEHLEESIEKFGSREKLANYYNLLSLMSAAGPAATAIRKHISNHLDVLSKNGGDADAQAIFDNWAKSYVIARNIEDIPNDKMDVGRILGDAFYKAKDWIGAQWPAIEAVANKLNEKGTLSGHEVMLIANDHWNHNARLA